jgi:hypothetical protein
MCLHRYVAAITNCIFPSFNTGESHIYTKTSTKAILNKNMNFNILSIEQTLCAPATEYRFSFGIMTGGRVLLPERRRSFRDFVLEENCLYVPTFMCVFIYKPHGRINLPLNIWKLHRTHNMFQ